MPFKRAFYLYVLLKKYIFSITKYMQEIVLCQADEKRNNLQYQTL